MNKTEECKTGNTLLCTYLFFIYSYEMLIKDQHENYIMARKIFECMYQYLTPRVNTKLPLPTMCQMNRLQIYLKFHIAPQHNIVLLTS